MQTIGRFRSFGRRRRVLGTAIASFLVLGQPVAGDESLPSVPGFEVEVYVSLSKPGDLTFDESGTLFTGNGIAGTPGHIRLIPVGGGSFETYGNTPLSDPDTVHYDLEGLISGTPGSVLVGGQGGGGNIWAIRPDESIIQVFGPSSEFLNPSDMAFDSTGRFLLSDLHPTKMLVLASDGGPLSALITAPAQIPAMAVDSTDRIFLRTSDGVVRIYDSAGSSVEPGFVVGLSAGPSLAFGPGGVWGTDLYLVSGENLLAIDTTGTIEIIGTEILGGVHHIEFSPDRRLFLTQRDVPGIDQDRILRITPACPADVFADGTVGTDDFLLVLNFWGPCADPLDCPADVNGNGQVDADDFLSVLAAWGPCP